MEFPDRVLEASRLSGGLAETEQATEVAFYHRVGGKWRARLSGHLGNQVGRGGMERISRRGGDTTMLGEAIGRAPAEAHANWPRSPLRMRFLDLRHRFLGDPEHRSFQRKVISRVGGFVANCPVNWGWRVQGGVSSTGALAGLLAFFDALAASKGVDSGIIGRALERLQIPARHDFRQLRKWCSREFLYDTLRRRELREERLFNMRTIERLLDEHFAGVLDHHVNLMLALDHAYAQQVFLPPNTRKDAAA